TVAVTDAWADRLVAACEATGDSFMAGPNPTAKNAMWTLTFQTRKYGPQRFTVPRARTTWLVDRLTAQVPLPVLLRQAGLTTISPIERAFTYVPDVPDSEADRLMRRDP